MKTVEFQATDGFALSGTLYGDAASARAGVVIAAAMGVTQRYYAEFAAWLAAQGLAVLTFDYRGMGASRPAARARSLRGFQADITTWAEQDAAAALDFLSRQLGAGRPVHWLGHSLGGQIFGLLPNRAQVQRLAFVACGSGYWRENVAALRRVNWALWFFLVPLLLPLAGYFPGRRLKIVGDVPAGAMAQWRRWCLHPDYLMGEGGEAWRQQYAQVHASLLSLSFTDDEFMSERNSAALLRFYDGARCTAQRIDPADIGAQRIGHFGFFRRSFEATLWRRVERFFVV